MVCRHGWKLFMIIAITGLIPAVVLWFAPQSAPTIMSTFGHEVPEAVAESAFFGFLSRWIATVLIGSNALTLFVAATALRRGERWAWYAMWYWPIMFASHLALYEGRGRISQAVWVVASVAVLVAIRPQENPRTKVAAARSTASA